MGQGMFTKVKQVRATCHRAFAPVANVDLLALSLLSLPHVPQFLLKLFADAMSLNVQSQFLGDFGDMVWALYLNRIVGVQQSKFGDIVELGRK